MCVEERRRSLSEAVGQFFQAPQSPCRESVAFKDVHERLTQDP
jgi:hypothetical protein